MSKKLHLKGKDDMLSLNMRRSRFQILSTLLEMASEEFGNHGCNDFRLPNTPNDSKLVNEILKAEEEGFTAQDFTYKNIIQFSDVALMDYFGKKIREVLKDE